MIHPAFRDRQVLAPMARWPAQPRPALRSPALRPAGDSASATAAEVPEEMEGLFNGKNTGFQQKMGESTWNLLGISLELLRLKVMFDVLIGCTTEESTMFFFGLVSKSKFLPAKLWIVGSTTLPKPCFFYGCHQQRTGFNHNMWRFHQENWDRTSKH